MPTKFTATQKYDAPPDEVFALFSDRRFVAARLEHNGGLDPSVVSFDAGDGFVDVVTRQGIPASALPSMVSNFINGDPSTQRTENWRREGDGYSADLKVTIHGAPASLKGSMALLPDGAGSVLTVSAEAVVPIPMFGGKIEKVIVEQVSELFALEEQFTREQLTG